MGAGRGSPRDILRAHQGRHGDLDGLTLEALWRGGARRTLEIGGGDILELRHDGLSAWSEATTGGEIFVAWESLLKVSAGACVLWARHGPAQPRGGIIVLCATCFADLSAPLKEVSSLGRLVDAEPVVGPGRYLPSSPVELDIHAGKLLVALTSVTLRPGPAARRHGCCGCAGSEGPNLACRCGQLVATEVSDCLTPHFVVFESERIMFLPTAGL